MKEYRIVCDRLSRQHEFYGGKENFRSGVTPIVDGAFAFGLYTDKKKAEEFLKETIRQNAIREKKNHEEFTHDINTIYREQTNFRIQSRTVTEWK